MDDLAIRRLAMGVALAQHFLHLGVADFAPAQRDLDRHDARRRKAAREVENDVGDGLARHLLGGVDGVQHRGRGRVEIDDLAGAHTAGDLVADPQDAWAGLLAARNEAAHLAGADIDGGDERAARARIGLGHVLAALLVRLPGLAGLGGSGAVRTTTRSARRRSTCSISRARRACSRSIWARWVQASATLVSGSWTVMALSSCRFQRRSPTRMAALTRCIRAGWVARIRISASAFLGASSPTTSSRSAKRSRCSVVTTTPSWSISIILPWRCHSASGCRSVRRI